MFNPKTLIIVSLVILLPAGYLAYWNKSKAYKSADDVRKKEQNHLQVNRDTLKRLTTERDGFNSDEEDKQEQIAKLDKELKDRIDMNDELKSDLKALSERAQYYKENPDVIRAQTDKAEIALETMDRIKLLDAEIKDRDKLIADRQSNLDRLTADNTELEGNITALRDHIESRSGGRSVGSLETAIRSVYNNWGFVTLKDGDKNGVVMNSTLDVVRGDETVAKLLVTLVEQDSASANIIPGSMAPDTILTIGDKVVPAKAGIAAAN